MRFTTYVKRLLYPLYIYPRITRSRRNKLHQLFSHLEKSPHEPAGGLRLFSNMEEDGILLQLLAALHIRKGYFIDIGSNDCINSNCANLAFNFDWKGIFIDADEKLLRIGERNYRLFKKENEYRFVKSFLTPDNVNDVILQNISSNDVDFLNIDIDGNDYGIWKALDSVQPKIVLVENKIEFGNVDVVTESGASLVSFNKLADEKGYRLVATNRAGFNAFFMRSDCVSNSGLKKLDINEVFLKL